MSIQQFTENPIWLNGLIFVIGAIAVWAADTKLSAYVDLFADRTGVGIAFAGLYCWAGRPVFPKSPRR